MSKYEIYSEMETLGVFEGENEYMVFAQMMMQAGHSGHDRESMDEEFKNTKLKFRKIIEYILCFGNPSDGFEYIGPFNSADEVNEYAHIYAIGLDWWIIVLQEPYGVKQDE